MGDRGLARAGRADQRGRAARRGARKVTSCSDRLRVRPARAPAGRSTPATRATPRRPSGSGTTTSSNSMSGAGPAWPSAAAARSGTASGCSSISGLRSSTSKTRSKLTSAVITSTCTLDSDGDRAVQPAEQRGQRDQRAELEGVPSMTSAPPSAVDHRGGQRRRAGSAR